MMLKQGAPLEASIKEEEPVSPKRLRISLQKDPQQEEVPQNVIHINDGSEYENEEISEDSSEEDSNLEVAEDEVEDEYHEAKKKSRKRSK